MVMKIWTALAVILVLAFLVPSGAKAQDLATILGTVTDSSGSVMPDAQVTVSNDETGFTRKVTSDAEGGYSVARIPIGEYEITAEKAGFQTLVRKGIHLDPGQTLRLDLQLQVGAVTEQVVISANAVAVETENGAISHVVTSGQVSELNLEARNFERGGRADESKAEKNQRPEREDGL